MPIFVSGISEGDYASDNGGFIDVKLRVMEGMIRSLWNAHSQPKHHPWGTVRSLHPETHSQLPNWIENIVANVCQTYGAKYQVNYKRLVPSVFNHPALTQLVQTATEEAWGHGAIEILPEPSLAAEDFSVYLEHTARKNLDKVTQK